MLDEPSDFCVSDTVSLYLACLDVNFFKINFSLFILERISCVRMCIHFMHTNVYMLIYTLFVSAGNIRGCCRKTDPSTLVSTGSPEKDSGLKAMDLGM